MAEGYTTVPLHWQGHDIAVSYQRNWLNSGNWHIELRCDAPLPVTQTGYRSAFLPDAELEGEADLLAHVTAWLDEAAQSKDWLRHVEDSRQGTLF